jgi:hypothetical protein
VPRPKLSSIGRTLGEALSEESVNELGRKTGQSKRLRVVTPFRLVAALLAAMAAGATETIADLCREFNFQNGTTTAYKPFYMRLARPAFAKFMRAVASRLMAQLAVRVLRAQPDSPLARFGDIVIQDGSSFAVKRALSSAFPGRFKTIEPAAIEVHATFSGFNDEVVRAHVSPDTAAERHFLPQPAELKDKLFLADRGYPSQPYLQALDTAGASFVVRLTRSFKPWVRAFHHQGRRVPLANPARLQQLLSQHPNGALDLDIEMHKAKQAFSCRLLVLPGKERSRTRPCTNLSRDEFPPELVSRLYRFRWQVELLFKEWKSYTNLRKFDTANKHIVRGLIWASLAAAVVKRYIAHAAEAATQVPISTRKVAMSARLFIRRILTSLGRPHRFRDALAAAVGFLAGNARRAHPTRDKVRGRLKAGLELCFAA